jgi:hypothetical protein
MGWIVHTLSKDTTDITLNINSKIITFVQIKVSKILIKILKILNKILKIDDFFG